MRKQASSANDFVFWGLMLLIAWAPLPLASNRPWSMAFLALLSGLLLLGLSIGNIAAQRERPPLQRALRLPLILAAVPLVWGLVQWSTWTPDSWHHPIWKQASDVLGRELAGRITVNPDATMASLMNLGTYLAVFWLAMTTIRHRDRAGRALNLFVGITTAYAAYGLAVLVSGSETILFFDKWDYFGSVTSTFVNRNSFATYAGLGLLCATGLALDNARQATGSRGGRRPTSQLVMIILQRNAVLFAAVLLLGSALILTGSRAGVASFLAGLLVLLGLTAAGNRGVGARALIVAIPLLVALTVAFWLASGPLVERLQRNPMESDRLPAYAVTLGAIENSPLLGTGYGTFQESFASNRDLTAASPSSWKKAHNSYLENLLELGIPAALSLNVAILLIALGALKAALTRRRSRLIPTIGVAATVLVGLHALVDFSLQIPAVAVSYAFIMGAAAAQAFRQDTAPEARAPA